MRGSQNHVIALDSNFASTTLPLAYFFLPWGGLLKASQIIKLISLTKIESAQPDMFILLLVHQL